MRVAIFGTHIHQFNGYSKVVYELCKATHAAYSDSMDLHIFGFQNFHHLPGHRTDFPPQIPIFDAHAHEQPKAQGFAITEIKRYVARVRPDVCVIFNDIIVVNAILKELKDAPNRADFKILVYLDQVYLCQRKELLEFLNANSDAVVAFTDKWRECIQWQGLKLPCHVLPHGINPDTYFPVPKALARKFFGVSNDDFLVLNLNRNQPRKRWDTCIQAFAEVIKRLPDAPIKLVIGTELVGSWNLIEVFERELRKRSIPLEKGMSRLVVPGRPQGMSDSDTNILYNIADVGINTCDGEGFGLCNFEQAAVGIPQIVPRIGGFLHYLSDENSTLVTPRLTLYTDTSRDGVGGEAELTHPDDYAEAIVAYYKSRELRIKHGAASRKSIMTRFTWSTIAARFRDILMSVCPEPRSAGNGKDIKGSPPTSTKLRISRAEVDAILTGGSRRVQTDADDKFVDIGVHKIGVNCQVDNNPNEKENKKSQLNVLDKDPSLSDSSHVSDRNNSKKKKKKKKSRKQLNEELQALKNHLEELIKASSDLDSDEHE